MKLNLILILFLGIIILISLFANQNLYEGLKKCALPQAECNTFTNVNDGYLLDTTKSSQLCEGSPCSTDADRTKCHKEATGQALGYKCIKHVLFHVTKILIFVQVLISLKLLLNP